MGQVGAGSSRQNGDAAREAAPCKGTRALARAPERARRVGLRAAGFHHSIAPVGSLARASRHSPSNCPPELHSRRSLSHGLSGLTTGESDLCSFPLCSRNARRELLLRAGQIVPNSSLSPDSDANNRLGALVARTTRQRRRRRRPLPLARRRRRRPAETNGQTGACRTWQLARRPAHILARLGTISRGAELCWWASAAGRS